MMTTILVVLYLLVAIVNSAAIMARQTRPEGTSFADILTASFVSLLWPVALASVLIEMALGKR